MPRHNRHTLCALLWARRVYCPLFRPNGLNKRKSIDSPIHTYKVDGRIPSKMLLYSDCEESSPLLEYTHQHHRLCPTALIEWNFLNRMVVQKSIRQPFHKWIEMRSVPAETVPFLSMAGLIASDLFLTRVTRKFKGVEWNFFSEINKIQRIVFCWGKIGGNST